ncbi:MAG TPA: ferritin family protein [Magnetospirillaceae bacterium]|nr:ferritin family protein [Magnetospirillaceae bacterium]
MENLLDAIRKGLKGEMDSVTVYMDAAGKSTGAVADFFLERGREEQAHYNWLLRYYKELSEGREPEANLAAAVRLREDRSPLVTQEFMQRVGSSQHLVTAVAAAALLEVEAVRHYRKAAEETSVPSLKAFFDTLSDWEESHYRDLLAIQSEAERYWFDAQRFEPF